MDKRTFLKTSSALAAGSLLAPIASCTPAGEDARITNWAGNLAYSAEAIHYPKSIKEVQKVTREVSRLRPLGSQHSFNDIADSPSNLVSTKRLNKIVSLDAGARQVTVEAGIKYGELVKFLHDNGYALHNLASLPHISVGGSIATATHGSGVRNGNLATPVSALEFVNASGEVVKMSREDGDAFRGAVVNLGALGVVTRITLDLAPTFNMQQMVSRNLPLEALKQNFLEVMSGGYSVSLFTDWSRESVNEVWVKSVLDDRGVESLPQKEYFGAVAAEKNLHPVETQSAESCTEQMGVPGPWYERLPHFRMGFTPSTGDELQSEYFVPLDAGYDALMAVADMGKKISPHLFISEIRTVDADDLWMSPCYKKTCMAIHTTWKPDKAAVSEILPAMEEQLAPFGPRPHWGKLLTLTPAVLQSRIARLGDFRELVRQHDPEGKFTNAFLEKYLFGSRS